MVNSKIKENQVIRLYAFPPTSNNARARVRKVYPNGDVWLSNVDLGTDGNINKIFSQEDYKNFTSTR